MVNIGEEAMGNEPNMMVEQNESIKLTKNTKGYNWEIKLLSLDLDRLEELNNEMKTKFKNE